MTLFFLVQITGHQQNVFVIDYKVCNGIEDMTDYYVDVCERGGDGIVLRDPDAPYMPGFSDLMWRKNKVAVTGKAKITEMSDTHINCVR